MQKVVIDTNVIVSALITTGYPNQIISELVLSGKINIQLSNDTFAEYVEVLGRPKFSKYPSFVFNAELVLSRIEEIAEMIKPTSRIDLIADEADNRFVELAVSSNADFLITGNFRDFTFEEIEGVKVVSPEMYWNKYKPEF